MKKMYRIEYYDYNGEDQKAYIIAESQEKAVDRLHSEYSVWGIYTIDVKEIEQKKYKVRKAKKRTTDKTRPSTDKTRHNTQKKITKKYSGKLPAFVCSNLCILETGREIRLSYFGDKVDTKTAREIILNLCVLYREQTSKGLGQTIDQRDVFTIIAELIQNESISYEEAKETALIFCSDYFFTSNIEQYTTQGV